MTSIISKSFASNISVVRQICEPLALLDINDFFYMRTFQDNTVVNLTTHAPWAELFYNNVFSEKYQNDDMKNHFFSKDYIAVWEHNQNNIIWQEGRSYFNVGNGVTINHRTPFYSESFSFFTDLKNSHINDFYHSHTGVLENFIAYFKDRASNIILTCQSEKFTLPKRYQQKPRYQGDRRVNDFLKKINSIEARNPSRVNPRFTKKEIECLYWLTQGKTAREIGEILHKSTRTIEDRINSLKMKSNSNKIPELIYKLCHSGHL